MSAYSGEKQFILTTELFHIRHNMGKTDNAQLHKNQKGVTYVTREGSGSFLPVAMQERDYIWNLFSYHVLHTAITLSHIETMYKCLTKEFFFLSQKSTCVLQFCYYTEEKTFKKNGIPLGHATNIMQRNNMSSCISSPCCKRTSWERYCLFTTNKQAVLENRCQ